MDKQVLQSNGKKGEQGKKSGRRFELPFFFFILPSLLIIIPIVAFPTAWVFWLSFQNWNFLSSATPTFNGVNNYGDFLFGYNSAEFLGKILPATASFVIGAAALEFLLGLGLAYLADMHLKGEKYFRTAFVIPVFMSGISIGFLYTYIYEPSNGILNQTLRGSGLGLLASNWHTALSSALPTAIITDAWQWTPFMFLIILAGMKALPRPVVEAAEVDGATALYRFRRVILPLLSPIIIIALLFRLLDLFNYLTVLYILYPSGGPGQSLEIISYFALLLGNRSFYLGQAATIAVFLLIITNVLAFYLIRRGKFA